MSKSSSSRTRYLAYIVSSFDGRISLDSSKIPDWTSQEDWDFFQKSLAKAGAIVCGRRTYQAAAKRLRQRNTFVLTSRVKSLKRRGLVTFVNPAKINLSELLIEHKLVAVIGGSQVYSYMLKHKLMDELYLTIEPIIFGHGQEMIIGDLRPAKLKLISVKKLNSKGTLLLHYSV